MCSDRNAAKHLLLLTVSMLPLACASAGSGTPAPRDESDARVFLVRSGVQLRLGTVGAHQRRAFVVPRSFLGGAGGFRLQSELLAWRERHRTDPIAAIDGDRIQFVIGHRLSLSWVAVLSGERGDSGSLRRASAGPGPGDGGRHPRS
jgi:hypothetical protein